MLEQAVDQRCPTPAGVGAVARRVADHTRSGRPPRLHGARHRAMWRASAVTEVADQDGCAPGSWARFSRRMPARGQPPTGRPAATVGATAAVTARRVRARPSGRRSARPQARPRLPVAHRLTTSSSRARVAAT